MRRGGERGGGAVTESREVRIGERGVAIEAERGDRGGDLVRGRGRRREEVAQVKEERGGGGGRRRSSRVGPWIGVSQEAIQMKERVTETDQRVGVRGREGKETIQRRGLETRKCQRKGSRTGAAQQN